MILYVSKFVSSFVMMCVTIYSWYRLMDKDISLHKKQNLISVFLLSIISIVNYYIINQYIRVLCITVVLIFFFWYLFKEKIQKTIITPIYTQLIIMISETIFAIIISLILHFSTDDLLKHQASAFITNIAISLLAFQIVKIPLVKKLYKYLINITDHLNNMIVISLFTIFIANLLSGILYYKVNFIFMMIINTTLTVFCFTIILYSFKTKNNYIKVYDKYNTTLNILKEYEDMLDRYRILNHENRNQLLMIRNMISRTNKKAISYIDKIVENKLKDNDRVMMEVSKIPAGGLKGLIYSKILTMKQLKINYHVDISQKINKSDLISIGDSIMLDLCQVVGVFIDNAIQAVCNLDRKIINIDMYFDETELVISVANNYEGMLEIDKMDQKKYTTKGVGHGYGLSLVKQIIDNNESFYNEKRVNKDIFTQILKIKM